ncbi:periplasmic solute binding protein [Beutenbergia cavernae DSM 12333]|uniref:Periplasmic solute binding protein n=1 Tax=Beutenbergia cavernae (strain ATCC BAA-8 / DSM 12333 / CCUG 43141 / JCM 11478 / NBRC 16432 / NCIMB 13614 / HKI 0122) TaxID=471853 RepID=C5C4Q3_BEUC1|nr:metal ABC transporter substrate-binding protein [Beutenbergia cavernae]ACQ80031.1 periplasmic solute binding protein [Beutenbergia cavernae DSM 12333]
MPLRSTSTRAAVAALTGAAALALTACGQAAPASDDGRLDVMASFYPLQFVAERVGGDAVTTSSLTPAGAEPHDLELSPADVASLGNAGLVVYLSGFQPAVDDAVAQAQPEHVLDVADAARLEVHEEEHEGEHTDDGHDHDGASDPHFWLDPTRLADAGDAVAASLAETEPDRADEFAANAADLRAELEELDTSFADGLATCTNRTIVVSHEAYGYLAERYDLHQVGISGVDPEAEPSPARLREISDVVETEGVTTIFTESLVNPQVAQVLADDLGVTTALLDPVEGLTDPDADYLTIMRANLDALRTALDCA